MSRSEIIRQTTIGATVHIGDRTEADEDLIIEGNFKVSSIDVKNNTLVVNKTSVVEADLYGHTVVVQGQVTGNVTATSLVHLENPGEIHGDITTPHFKMDPDCIFQGRITYT